MTYPSGSGTMTNNYGPSFAPAATQGAATPFPAPAAAPAAPGAPAGAPTQDTAVYNFNNAIMSTQEMLKGTVENVSQQGVATVTNVTAATLAGMTPGSMSFVKFQ